MSEKAAALERVAPVRTTFAEKKSMALAAYMSNVASLRSTRKDQAVGEAIVKIQYGEELGIGPMSALMGLYVVEGKISWSAGLVASRIKASGKYDFHVIERTDKGCRPRVFRGRQVGGPDRLHGGARGAGRAAEEGQLAQVPGGHVLRQGADGWCAHLLCGGLSWAYLHVRGAYRG